MGSTSKTAILGPVGIAGLGPPGWVEVGVGEGCGVTGCGAAIGGAGGGVGCGAGGVLAGGAGAGGAGLGTDAVLGPAGAVVGGGACATAPLESKANAAATL